MAKDSLVAAYGIRKSAGKRLLTDAIDESKAKPKSIVEAIRNKRLQEKEDKEAIAEETAKPFDDEMPESMEEPDEIESQEDLQDIEPKKSLIKRTSVAAAIKAKKAKAEQDKE